MASTYPTTNKKRGKIIANESVDGKKAAGARQNSFVLGERGDVGSPLHIGRRILGGGKGEATFP